MNEQRPRFSFYTYFYAGLFCFGLCSAPFIVAGTETAEFLPEHYWWFAAFWPVGIVALSYYASRRCSSERLTYWQGLLWVSASMITGWSYFSLFLIAPALLAVFIISLAGAFYGDFHGDPGYAQRQYQRLIYFFYRNRMRQ